MKVFSFLITLFICSSITAQINIDSMRLQYNQKTMLLGSGVTMNGFMPGKTEVQNLMLVSPEATRSYKLYKKNNRTGAILPVIGLVAVVGGLIISKDNRTPGFVIILGGNTISIIGSVFRRVANNHLQKAVWAYNRDVLFPVK